MTYFLYVMLTILLVMISLGLFLTLFQVFYALSISGCDNSDYEAYYRKHLSDWQQSCEDIQKKAPYRKYPMNFSILSDFSDEDLEKMMDLGVKYSGEGSYAEPESTPAPSWPNEYVVGRDLCEGTEKYSVSNSDSTSWASALVLAAEAALRKEGRDAHFSLPYVLKCLKESQEVEFNEVSPSADFRRRSLYC